VSSCWALYKKGGYGALFGVAVETRSEIKRELLRLKSRGADIIKVMASGMVSLKKPGTITPGGFDREEIRFLVEEAADLGLNVMAHANGEAAIAACAEAGVRSVEHGFFMTPFALEVLAKNKVYWVPTVNALARCTRGQGSNETQRFISDLVSSHLDLLRKAHSIGVPLAVGTDCVLPDPHYKAAYEAELGYFQQAGISSDAAMKIASEGGARLLAM
jgi:imidazolonepropionase-like amidohydrolase